MTKKQLNTDRHFMRIAQEVASQSKCPKAQYGGGVWWDILELGGKWWSEPIRLPEPPTG